LKANDPEAVDGDTLESALRLSEGKEQVWIMRCVGISGFVSAKRALGSERKPLDILSLAKQKLFF